MRTGDLIGGRYRLEDELGSGRTRLSGRDAFVLADGCGERSCAVRVAYRPFTDLHGQARVEIVIVVVSGGRPGRTYCRAATDLAEAAAANLPG
ncbi:hypothetical protein ACFOY2_43055 [Nonomuraea purpurea]|uniref:PPM-type phosphatase domain-containing protein n=1 Tax=Nonomuraea purpurea TaxID=1849276 RepID=A0ABV8GJT5_9ACTN